MESKTSIGAKIKPGKVAFRNKKSLMPQGSAGVSRQMSSTQPGIIPSNEALKKRFERKVPKIWDEELKRSSIKPVDLLMIRANRVLRVNDGGKRRKSIWMPVDEEMIVVRKVKPESPGQNVMVLKPAPPDAEILSTNYAGPRFDEKGKFIFHSILGCLEDFKSMALQKGEFEYLFTKPSISQKKKKPVTYNESSPLKAWNSHLEDWKSMRHHLSSVVSRPVADLLMNTADFYPKPILDRNHVHAALETVNSSHGEKRQASRFWKQKEQMGDDVTGIHTTLTEAEKGTYMASDVFYDVPTMIKQEKGNGVIKRNYPAYYTHYLDDQREAVRDVIHILNPHHPFMEELNIRGENLQKRPTVLSGGDGLNVSGEVTLDEKIVMKEQEKIQNNKQHKSLPMNKKWDGPAVMIGGQVFQWVGPNRDQKGTTAGVVSVLFEGTIGKNILRHLEIHNVGTTVIHYEWTKNVKKGLEDVLSFQNTKFYFLTEGGVMAPGETVKLPVLFRARIGGIFSESWKFMSRPLLSGGADIIVNLKSVISIIHLSDEEINEIEKSLTHRNAITIARKYVEDIFREVKTPTPPSSPEIEYISEAQKFQNHFPGMKYHSCKSKEMESLYATILNSIPGEFQRQECSLVAMKEALGKLMSLDLTNEEDEEKCWEEMHHRHSCLAAYNHLCSSLLFRWPTPVQSSRFEYHKIGLTILQGAVDKFVDMTYTTAVAMGLPLKVDEEEEAIDKAARKAPPKKSLPTKPKKKDIEKALSPGGATKDEKVKATPSHRGRPKTSSPESIETTEKAPDSFLPVVSSKISNATLSKYRNRIYIQTYLLMESTFEQMLSLFDN